ncbi:MAG: D-sedoheptulose 7-phosphate isomerase [Candidatus Margulisiibacteriota bacterium]
MQDSIAVKQSVAETMSGAIAEAALQMIDCIRSGGKIAFCGNGGSAADSQHLAAELVSRFRKERASYPSLALSTNTSIITAIGNDYSFDKIFARQVEGLLCDKDVLVGISTSGNSANVIEALKTARTKNIQTVCLTGEGGGKMKDHCGLLLAVPSSDTPRVQEAHILIGHILCGLIEDALC